MSIPAAANGVGSSTTSGTGSIPASRPWIWRTKSIRDSSSATPRKATRTRGVSAAKAKISLSWAGPRERETSTVRRDVLGAQGRRGWIPIGALLRSAVRPGRSRAPRRRPRPPRTDRAAPDPGRRRRSAGPPGSVRAAAGRGPRPRRGRCHADWRRARRAAPRTRPTRGSPPPGRGSRAGPRRVPHRRSLASGARISASTNAPCPTRAHRPAR